MIKVHYMETSLGRLQKQVDTQSRQIVRLQDNLEHQKKEKIEIQNSREKTERKISKYPPA